MLIVRFPLEPKSFSPSIIGKYSDVYNNINPNIVDNQIDSMKIIKDIVDKI